MEKTKLSARVIITSARSLMALVAAHSLGKRGVEVVGADCVKPTMLQFSKYTYANETYHRHLDDPEQFLSDIETIIDKHKPDDDRPYILMPIFHENFLIIQNKQRLEKRITVATPDKLMLEQVFPKDKLAKTAQKLDVNIPTTLIPDSDADIDKFLEDVDFPCLIKPRNSSGGRGIHKVDDSEELKAMFQKVKNEFGEPPLIQALVDGEEFCHTVIYDDGKEGASGAYRNLHSYPADFGSGAIREAIDPYIFNEQTKPLFENIGWNGLAEIDYMWDGNKNHTPHLIEVNPRFWAGMFHSVQSGVDFPWLNFHLFAYGKLPEEKSVQISGKKTKEPITWLLSIIEESVDLATNFEDIKSAGEEAIKLIKKKDFKGAFNGIISSLKDSVSIKEARKHYKHQVKDAKDIESQFSEGDDPFVAIGGLYILTYWLKYKKLPPEVGGD